MSLRLKLTLLLGATLAVGLACFGLLSVTVESAAMDAGISPLEQAGLLLAMGVAILIVALACTWMLTGAALAGLARITGAAEEIAASGDVERPIPMDATADEAARLAKALQSMTARLRDLLETQRHLLADTSHELRNPLTVIQTNLDLLRRDLDPRTRQEVAEETSREVERMTRLVADLLLLAEMEGPFTDAPEAVRVDELAQEVAHQLEAQAPSTGSGQARRIIDLKAPEPIVVIGDGDQIRRMLLNLVDNAIQYTPPGSRISVSVERRGRRANILVSDTGPGIAPEHLPHIFDRFYRVDPARRRDTGGTGLGLSIVKQVAEAHGGRVQVESEPGSGSTFRVTLPAEPSWVPLATVPSEAALERD